MLKKSMCMLIASWSLSHGIGRSNLGVVRQLANVKRKNVASPQRALDSEETFDDEPKKQISVEPEIKRAIDKLRKLSVKINTNLLDSNTLRRVDRTSTEFLDEMVKNLFDYYCIKLMPAPTTTIEETLKNHDDWTALTRSRLADVCDIFRSLSLTPDIYTQLLARHPALLTATDVQLTRRLNELRHFFTRAHLDRLLPRSPHLFTSSFDSFRYKFNYAFVLMGFEQREMASTHLFNCELEFIRQRHLFLERSLLFDRPNKKGITRVENPKLAHIILPNLSQYLQICTRGLLTEEDFRVFCSYLESESFDDELLGERIDTVLKKQILHDIRVQKRDDQEYNF